MSFDGRLTVVRAFIAQLMFYASICLLPKTFYVRYERLARKILWAEREDKRRHHMVKWALVTTPKEEGGLGVLDARRQTIDMIAKLIPEFLEKQPQTCFFRFFWTRLDVAGLMSGVGCLQRRKFSLLSLLGSKTLLYLVASSKHGRKQWHTYSAQRERDASRVQSVWCFRWKGMKLALVTHFGKAAVQLS